MNRLVVLATLFLLFPVSGCRDAIEPGRVTMERPRVANVRVEAVQKAEADRYYETAGTIEAVNTSVIASRIMAAVTSVAVEEGDRVAGGQLLATLDNSDLLQKVKAAEAAEREADKALAAAKQNLELTETTVARYRNLFNGKALTRQELDEAETRSKVARLEYERLAAMSQQAGAGLAEARTFLGFSHIIAPYAGIITARHVDSGSMAAPGLPLFTVAGVSELEVAAGVDERFAGRLHTGQPVLVTVAALDRSVTGTIKKIVGAVDPGSRSFTVKIGLTDTDLQPGLYAKIRVPLADEQVVSVPGDCLVHKGQLIGVYTVGPDNIITYRVVRTGKSREKEIEILSGLNAGEKIITQGMEHAVDGGILAGD
jgi:RND family efflux transporter MFP subunit